MNLQGVRQLTTVSRKIDLLLGLKLLALYIGLRLIKNPKCRDWLSEKKHSLLRTFLFREFAGELPQLKERPIYPAKQMVNDFEHTIWIYWDDLTTLPLIARKCIEQATIYAGTYAVRLLEYSTVRAYLHDIPEYIYQKYEQGLITRTHFSDIVRVNLLRCYGGIYMDATLLQTGHLLLRPEDFDFLTIKLPGLEDRSIVSQARWCVFFMACRQPGCLLMEILSDWMNRYWKKYDTLFDYLLIDYFIDFCYEHIPAIRQLIDSVPVNNSHVFALNWGKGYTDEQFSQFHPYADTVLYKTSAKAIMNTPDETPEGLKTLKWYLVNRWGEDARGIGGR